MMVSLIRVLALVAAASGSVAIVGGVIRYAWLILAVVAAVALLWLLWFAVWLDRRLTTRDATRAARAAALAAVAARADQQHAWVLAGDDRGTYGDYVPTQID
jgi:hypothetical protein